MTDAAGTPGIADEWVKTELIGEYSVWSLSGIVINMDALLGVRPRGHEGLGASCHEGPGSLTQALKNLRKLGTDRLASWGHLVGHGRLDVHVSHPTSECENRCLCSHPAVTH